MSFDYNYLNTLRLRQCVIRTRINVKRQAWPVVSYCADACVGHVGHVANIGEDNKTGKYAVQGKMTAERYVSRLLQ